MRQTISFVTLGVADLERSRRFYSALGWRESSASQPAVAFFQAGKKRHIAQYDETESAVVSSHKSVSAHIFTRRL